jgi:undecaprenyl-diphosphatase
MQGSYPFPGPVALAGLVSSFIVGVAALKWLLGWLEEGKFHYFGIYCLCVGLITLVI